MEQKWYVSLFRLCSFSESLSLFSSDFFFHSKIGGEGLRNRGLVNEEDRISELPEALLLLILSSLPTETVIATSVLSKQWKSLWKLVPNLKFDSKYHYHYTFSDNVCRSLISHKAPVLDSLHLKVEDKDDALDVGILIGIAFSRHMRKFVLNIAGGKLCKISECLV